MVALHKVIKRMHNPLKVVLICVRWYAAYPLSLRHIEECWTVCTGAAPTRRCRADNLDTDDP